MRLTALFLILTLAACDAAPPEPIMHKRAWAIMGTTLEITVYRVEAADAAADFEAAYSEIEAIDRLMSLYRADSELTALNESAGGPALQVSAATRDVLEAAQHFWRISDGALDVAVQPLIDLWGFYDVSSALLPREEDVARALALSGLRNIEMTGSMVRLSTGTALDFGAIAKGYAVDLALDALTARGAGNAMVNLGGTIGVTGPHPNGTPWRIGLQHPREAALLATVELSTGAVATSGDYDRFFESDGQRYSHIVDPRTGWPVAGMASVSVIAPNATTADALSTAAFVLGPSDGLALLNDCASISGLVAATGQDGRLEVSATESGGFLAAVVPVIPSPGSSRACLWSTP